MPFGPFLNDDDFMDLQVAIIYNHLHMVHVSPQTNYPILVPLISLVPWTKKPLQTSSKQKKNG